MRQPVYPPPVLLPNYDLDALPSVALFPCEICLPDELPSDLDLERLVFGCPHYSHLSATTPKQPFVNFVVNISDGLLDLLGTTRKSIARSSLLGLYRNDAKSAPIVPVITDFIFMEDREKLASLFGHVILGARGWTNVPIRLVHRDGALVNVLYHYEVVRHSNGFIKSNLFRFQLV